MTQSRGEGRGEVGAVQATIAVLGRESMRREVGLGQTWGLYPELKGHYSSAGVL